MFRRYLISTELDHFHHCAKFCWITLICGVMKIQTPQDSSKFRTVPVWGCRWSGNTWSWEGGQNAEQDQVFVAVHHCPSPRWLCLIRYAIIYPPSQPLPSYFWLLFFTADANTNISHDPEKATLRLYMFQVFARDGTLLFLPQTLLVNTKYFNDFFHSKKTIKGKQNLSLFSYHAGPHCWTIFGSLQKYRYGYVLRIIKIISLHFPSIVSLSLLVRDLKI